MESGNTFLKYVANQLVEFGKSRELFCCAHFHADIFVACGKCAREGLVIAAIELFKRKLKSYSIDFNIRPIFGIYMINDARIADPDDIYDKVSLASRQCKRNHLYDKNYEFYVEPLREKLKKIQEYVNIFPRALEEGQFKVYLQPKYELVSNTISGSEALVRWINDQGEMISPGEFIPAFEQNGFILKLDYVMWEQVCKLLSHWLKEGKRPKPISVNISRMDVYNPELVSQIIELVDRYQVRLSCSSWN
jgi:deoxycytidine triphosphate deaminase